ncbi:hypothetical protein BaRGS_00035564, partial [Batillaria attramentaria]
DIPVDAVPGPSNVDSSDSDDLPSVSVSGSQYQKRKLKEVQTWQALREEALHARIEEFSPATFQHWECMSVELRRAALPLRIISVGQREASSAQVTFCSCESELVTLESLYRSIIGDPLTEFRLHQCMLQDLKVFPGFGSVTNHDCPICTQFPSLCIMAMDANFGLVHKRSSGQGTGIENARHQTALFCDDSEVESFVATHSVTTKKNTCSDFQAGNAIRSKNRTSKLDVTGVFGAVCQHDIPLKFHNMKHGERFGYPVYLLKKIAAERDLGSSKISVMYDVACSFQAHVKNVASQHSELAENFRFVVPAFHSYAHNLGCQLSFGQRYTDGCGMTDGEGCERLWSYLRSFSSSTKKMNLPNRQDLLTDALFHYAENSLDQLGRRLLHRLEKATQTQGSAAAAVQTSEDRLVDGTASQWLIEWNESLQKHTDQKAGILFDHAAFERGEVLDDEFPGSTAENQAFRPDLQVIHFLEEAAMKLQADLGLNEPWETTPDVINTAKAARTIRERHHINTASKLAVERQHLLTLSRKYSDGQAVASRLSKKLQLNSKKCNQVITSLEEECRVSVNLDDMLNPASSFYLDNCTISKEQMTGAMAYADLKRAQEEEAAVRKEIEVYLSWLEGLNRKVHILADGIKVEDRLSRGTRHLLRTHKLTCEQELFAFTQACVKAGLQACSFDRSVTVALNAWLQRPLEEVAEEDDMDIVQGYLSPVDEISDFSDADD